MSTVASHYSQHALASLRRRPAYHHPTLPPSPASPFTRSRSIGSAPGLSPPQQFSMIDFLRSQSPGSPTSPTYRQMTVVDALRATNTYTYTALPSPPFESSSPISVKSYPSPAAAAHSRAMLQSGPESPSPKSKRQSHAPKPRNTKRDSLATFFRWTEPTPELRPLLLSPMARPAKRNPARQRIKEDDATRLAAADSRVVPIGGARAARQRARQQWEEQLARGRPSLSLDIDSEMSYERERVETPIESVFVARERERDSWLKR